MPTGLVRYHGLGHFHFVTVSCFARRPYFAAGKARSLFETSLEKIRMRYEFCVAGYVLMPEHVHLLLSEPAIGTFARAMQAIKLSVSVQSKERPFWTARYHDFNVYTEEKRVEKLRYLHRNPVRRGLVEKPEEWAWSSFRHYATGERGVVEIESEWTAARRQRERLDPMSQRRDMGHPMS